MHRSSLASVGNVDQHPDSHSSTLRHSIEETKAINAQERRSNHTFTPPTSSLSNQSSSNDLHMSFSSISVDIPPLNYAMEKLLSPEDTYLSHTVEELPMTSAEPDSGRVFRCFFFQDTSIRNYLVSLEPTQTVEVPMPPLEDSQKIVIDQPLVHERKSCSYEANYPSLPIMSNYLKWYVSELRINRPLIYRRATPLERRRDHHRRFSHSYNDLNQMCDLQHRSIDSHARKMSNEWEHLIYSTLSLEHWNYSGHERQCQSNEHIFPSDHWSATQNNRNLVLCVNNDEDEEDEYEDSCHSRTSYEWTGRIRIISISVLAAQRILNRSVGNGDTLIRNESVKKKLFDILNDDELENACLEDMSEELDQLPMIHRHSFKNVSSTVATSDDPIYSSPPIACAIPLAISASLSSSSSSFNDNHLSTATNYSTADRYYSRSHSHLITTSLDPIPINSNNNAASYLSVSPQLRPSWFTSPSPQWRLEDQQPITVGTSERDLGVHENIRSQRLLRNEATEYSMKENKYLENCTHHCRNEQKCVDYSLLNSSTPIVDDATMLFPLISDKPSNLLMFI